MEAENLAARSTSARCSRADLARCLRGARTEISGSLGDLLATVRGHIREVERLQQTFSGRAIQYDSDHVVHDLFTAREQMRSIAAKLERAVRLAGALESSVGLARARARTLSCKTQCVPSAGES